MKEFFQKYRGVILPLAICLSSLLFYIIDLPTFIQVILIILGACIGFIAYFRSKKELAEINLLGVLGISLAIAGICIGIISSEQTLNKIEHALYPEDFEVKLLNQKKPVPPNNSKIHSIEISDKKLTYKHYGFPVSVTNTSDEYPAQNVFVRVYWEKNRFNIDELKNEENRCDKKPVEGNVRIRNLIYNKWTKPGRQCYTVDSIFLPHEITGGKKTKELIGIGFVLQALWKQTEMHFYLPLDVSLKGEDGLVAIKVNDKKFFFKYIFESEKKSDAQKSGHVAQKNVHREKGSLTRP